MNIKRVLVPIDFSERARPTLDYALFLARRFGARVDALNVWELPITIVPDWVAQVPDGPPQPISEIVRGRAALELDVLLRDYEDVHPRLESGNPADTIVRLAAQDGYDLIVMGTHGRTGLSHMWLGSVAEKVVRHATCPVLTIHGREKQHA